MKILLLLSGYPGNVNSLRNTVNLNKEEVNLEKFYKGFQYYEKLLSNFKTKVICSIWDNVGIEEIKNFYNPVICKNYNQKKFQDNFYKSYQFQEKYIVEERIKWFKKVNLKDELFVPTSRYASQLFIRQQVCRNALNYIKDQSYNPDIVILSRFDIASRGGLAIRNPIEIGDDILNLFKKNYKNKFIIIPQCNQLNLGYPDMWFYLNKNALFEMKDLYKVYLNSIYNNGSSYIKYLVNGWPSSEWFDLKDKYDKRQFSNVILKRKKNLKLMKYFEWESPNVHMYYKYFISIRDKPLKIHFSKIYLSYFSMLKFSGLRFSFFAIIFSIFNYLKSKLKYKSKKYIDRIIKKFNL